jgi:hypothetical protein
MPTTTQVESSTTLTTPVTPKTASNDWTNIKEFVELLHEKDKTIEEKNQLIFAMQHQIGQMESRLQQVVALPDYTLEKNTLEHSIQNLEQQKSFLEDQVRREKLRNTVYM